MEKINFEELLRRIENLEKKVEYLMNEINLAQEQKWKLMGFSPPRTINPYSPRSIYEDRDK